MSKKTILLFSTREKWRSKLEIAVRGFTQFFDYNYEFKTDKSIVFEDIDRYDLGLSMSWYLSDFTREMWKVFRERKIPVFFLSDGCFFYHYKHIRYNESRILEYPYAVFLNGPQSAPFGEKFYRDDLPDDRVRLFSPEINLVPWRKYTSKKHILISHQCGGTYEGGSKQPFYREAVRIAQSTGRPLIYRLHPQSSYNNKKFLEKLYHIENCRISKSSDRSMMSDLRNAHCLLTYGGKAAARAILSGVPAITYNITIAEMVAERDLSKIEEPRMSDRKPWQRWLSYCHWTLEEMRDGFTWRFFVDNGYVTF